MKKIIFMGTPDYATAIFKKLLESDFDLLALYTQPDKKIGRKQVLTPPSIKQYCLDNGLSLPIYQPNSLKENETIQTIKKLNPDYIVVAAYGHILPQPILDIAPCVNLHASLLPKYRGASPIQQSLINNDTYTGVTAMIMEKDLDSGDILALDYISIDKEKDSIAELFDKLSVSASNLIIDVLNNFENIKPKKQDLSKVSYCSKITKEDGAIDFINANIIYQKYKAYKIWPEIFTINKLKIKECRLIETISNNEAGIILKINKHNIIIGCKKGSLEISKLQPPSKNIMNASDYIRGARLVVGNNIARY